MVTFRAGSRSKFSSPNAMQAALASAIGGSKPTDEVADKLVETTEVGFELTASPADPVTSSAVEVHETKEVVLTYARPSVSAGSCVRALEKAVGFGRSALYLEVSVALAIFASSSTGADRATMRVVMDIYSQAGFDVSSDGPHYKTVNRRINASKSLFNKLGAEAIINAMHGLREGKAIDSLCSYLGETYKFDSLNALLEFVGKPVEQTNTPEVRAARAAKEIAEATAATVGINERIAQRRAERQVERQQVDVEDGIIVSAGKLSLVIPRECSSSEIRAMAAKLVDFADRMDAEAGTPEEQRNREMHS